MQYQICRNMQEYTNKNMQYMCIISINMLKYAKTTYAHICENTLHMHKYAQICTTKYT